MSNDYREYLYLFLALAVVMLLLGLIGWADAKLTLHRMKKQQKAKNAWERKSQEARDYQRKCGW